MSRALLMVSGLRAGSTAGGPPSGGDVDPPAPSGPLGYPATTDAYITSLRPHGRRVATAKVGVPQATHTTIGDALTAVGDAALNAGLQGGLFWDYGGPDYGADVFVGPGTYNEPNGGGGWRTLVGLTGDPDDVVLRASDGGGGVIHSYGSMYMENITLHATSDDGDLSPKYPWHITGGPITIAVNCVFDVRGAVSGASVQGGNRTAGLVGKDSSSLTVFYKCKFIGDPAAGITGFNMHGTGNPGQFPETAIFLDCETEGVSGIGNGGDVDINGVGPRLYVIGLTHDAAMTTILADANTTVYTDTDLPVSGNPVAVNRGVTEPPALDDGLIPEVKAYYYPSGLSSINPADIYPAVVNDAAPMAPVPGRMYLTRVRMSEAQRIQRVGFNATTAAGGWGGHLEPADTAYERDVDPSLALPGTGTAVVVGNNEYQHYYAYTRYPGDNGIWAKVRFDNAAARVTGSASLPGLTDCYYTDDGVSWVQVPAGTPHPLVYIAAN